MNNFCREIGITRTGGELPLHILDHHVRGDLHLTSPRTLAVLHPLKVVITNLPEDHYEMMDAKASPADLLTAMSSTRMSQNECNLADQQQWVHPALQMKSLTAAHPVELLQSCVLYHGSPKAASLQVFPFPGKDETYQVPFTRVVYIEQDDFREQDQKKYFGLAPGKTVLLRCPCLTLPHHPPLACSGCCPLLHHASTTFNQQLCPGTTHSCTCWVVVLTATAAAQVFVC